MAKPKPPKGKILFKKIGFINGRVRLKIDERFDDEVNKSNNNYFQAPLDSFFEAMNDLAQDIVTICELPDPKKDLYERIQISEIDFDYKSQGDLPGFSIHFKITTSNGLVDGTTPYRLLETREEEIKKTAKNETIARVYELMEEANKYLNGERQNYSFKFEEPEAVNDESIVEENIAKNKDVNEKIKSNIIEKAEFVVKADGQMIGVIKPGLLIQLTQLVNSKGLLSNGNKNGIYILNPGPRKKVKTENGYKRNGFTFRRNGDVLILEKMMEVLIEDYSPDIINNHISSLITESFKINNIKKASA